MARELKCPKCKQKTVTVQMVEVGSTTKRSGVGLLGNAHNAVRGIASVATLGFAGKIIGKAEGKNKTKVKLQKMAICQSCGHSWEL